MGMGLLQRLRPRPRPVFHTNPSRPIPVVSENPETPIPILIDPKQVDYHVLVIVNGKRLADHFKDRLTSTPQAAALAP